MSEEVTRGIFVIFAIICVGFMAWMIVDHNGHFHDDHYRPQYRNGVHFDDGGVKIQIGTPKEYYCPQCSCWTDHCHHYQQYCPRDGHYYCPQCRRWVQDCSHHHYNPFRRR
jgi:hypothetical protein